MTSVKYDRAESHISGQVSPLSYLIVQVYMWGHTRTLGHWRKELASVVLVLQDNSYPSGKLMKLKDMNECLLEVKTNRSVARAYRAIFKDPEYIGLSSDRVCPPSIEQTTALVNKLINDVMYTENTHWDIADTLIELINNW